MLQHLRLSEHYVSVHLGIQSLTDKALHTQSPPGRGMISAMNDAVSAPQEGRG